jgi:hypothetical protein
MFLGVVALYEAVQRRLVFVLGRMRAGFFRENGARNRTL